MTTADPALLEEATRRSGLLWVALPGAHARPVWHLWHDGAVWLLVAHAPGSPEQTVPGLLDAERVRVVVRSKDKGGRLVAYDARVDVVDPTAAQWNAVAPLLLEKRLNVPGGAASAAERWRRECVLARLTPLLPLVEGPDRMPTDSHAAPPATSRARTPDSAG